MKHLFYNDETHEAERIVKTENSIIGYNGNNETFAFRGISDFSQFELIEGQEFDIAEPTEKERIEMLEDTINFLLGL